MSWQKGTGKGAVGIYFPKKQGFATTPIEAVGMFIIDKLEELLPSIKWGDDEIPIKYNWVSPQTPKSVIDSPAIALSIDLVEMGKLGQFLETNDSTSIVAGGLYELRIMFVIISPNTKIRDALENLLDRKLMVFINTTNDHPIQFIRKDEFGWERGFNQSQQNVYTVLYQNETDMEFVKTVEYRGSILQDFIDPDNTSNIWLGVIGSISGTYEESSISEVKSFKIMGGSHISLRITYQPGI